MVKADKEVIIIEPTNPNYVYVPAYSQTVVYGAWSYPAYPPYPVYPPGYVATSAAFTFMAGSAVGATWGNAWGNANWHGGEVNVNVNKNANINNNINRQKYQQQYQARGQTGQAGQGKWQHDASHRGGVAYRDQSTAQKYNRGSFRGNRGFPGRPIQARAVRVRGFRHSLRGPGIDRVRWTVADRQARADNPVPRPWTMAGSRVPSEVRKEGAPRRWRATEDRQAGKVHLPRNPCKEVAAAVVGVVAAAEDDKEARK